MQVGRKDERIFVNGAVLYHVPVVPTDVHHLPKTAVQEVDLEVERPTLHFRVEVVQIGVFINILKVRFPTVVSGQQLGQGSLPRPNISGNGYVHGPKIGLFLDAIAELQQRF